MKISREKLRDMLRTMILIRTFEETVKKKFSEGQIPGFVHLYIGQEAIATGTCANLSPDDYITSTHGGHGHVIAKGCNIDHMMAELYGRTTGCNKGKGGSMHIADIKIGILGANAIVGAGITIAGGAAISSWLRESGQVTACFIGDGATNTSRFHEGVNLASVWSLPIVYVIENNRYAESTSIKDVMKVSNISDRASAYGIPGITVDGNDVLAVYEAVGGAVARARSGEGPTIVECITCRQCGHYEGDAQTYRTKAEIEECVKNDPITRFTEEVIKRKALTKEDIAKIRTETGALIEKAITFAEESPLPDPEEALADVYA